MYLKMALLTYHALNDIIEVANKLVSRDKATIATWHTLIALTSLSNISISSGDVKVRKDPIMIVAKVLPT